MNNSNDWHVAVVTEPVQTRHYREDNVVRFRY